MRAERLDSRPVAQQRLCFAATGFTLLEVLIAIAILAIVLMAVYRLHGQSIGMAAASRFYSIAPALAQTRIGAVQQEADFATGTSSGDFGDDFSGYTWQQSVTPLASESLGNSAQSMRRLDILVSQPANQLQYRLRRYVYIGRPR
jgi:general secretion pathway protein I